MTMMREGSAVSIAALATLVVEVRRFRCRQIILARCSRRYGAASCIPLVEETRRRNLLPLYGVLHCLCKVAGLPRRLQIVNARPSSFSLSTMPHRPT